MSIIEGDVQAPASKPAKRKSKAQSVAIHQPQPPAAQAVPSNLTILQQAMERGATGDDLKNMLDLYERLEASASRKAFDEAMARFHAEMPTIIKTRLVDLGGKGYKHEDLAAVVAAIKPIMHKHGLAHRFRTESLENGRVRVTCIITGHGHREETPLEGEPDKGPGRNAMQAIGSAVTYLERYTLKAALGLAASIDDDGRGGPLDAAAITAPQLKELEALIAEVDAKEANICKACHVESLAEMTAAQFEKAKAKLETMRAPL